MKKIVSLAVSLILLATPATFGADTLTSGNLLKAHAFISGDQNGNLNEYDALTRSQLMVLMAQLNGVVDNAKAYSESGRFSDVNYATDWFGPYVAYAEHVGWTIGYPDGTFKPNGPVSNKELATVLYKALGYPPQSIVFDEIIDDLKAIGIEIEADNTSGLLRGEAFSALWKTVNTKKYKEEVTLGEKLGKLSPVQVLEPAGISVETKNVTALGNTLVEIEFENDLDSASALQKENYAMTEKKSGKTLEISALYPIDTTHVLISTSPMEYRMAYTLSTATGSKGFYGMKRFENRPKVKSVHATDTNLVSIEFDRVLDYASAADPVNYQFSNTVTVLEATLVSGGKGVELLTDGTDKRTKYTLTVSGVSSTDGIAMQTSTHSFMGKPDTKAPVFKDLEPVTNGMLYAYFSDTHGVDQAAIEDLGNWTLNNGGTIKSVEALKSEDTDHYDSVRILTSDLKNNKKYTLTVTNLTDGSTARNMSEKSVSKSFYAKKKDISSPKLKLSAVPLSDNLILVTFKDASALDPSSVLYTGNYAISADLKVRDVDWMYPDANRYSDEGRMVLIKTSKQKSGKSYKLTVSDISDEFGNTMDNEETLKWSALSFDTEDLEIEVAEAFDLETVIITFTHPIMQDSGETLGNYLLGELGSPLEAVWEPSTPNQIRLTFSKGSYGKSYTLSVSNISDFSGNDLDSSEITITFPEESIIIPPEVIEGYFASSNELRVRFSQAMTLEQGTTLLIKQLDTNSNLTHSAEYVGLTGDEYIFRIDAPESIASDSGAYEIVDILYEGTTIANTQGASLDMDSLVNIVLFPLVTAPQVPEVVELIQVNARMIEVHFSDAMILASNASEYVTGNTHFSIIEIDPDDATVVYFTSEEIITEVTQLMLNMHDVEALSSVDGTIAANQSLEVNTRTFTSAPSVISVEALTADSIQILYDRELTDSGEFIIFSNTGQSLTDAFDILLEGDTVTLTLTVFTLEPDVYYTLQISGTASYNNSVTPAMSYGFYAPAAD